MKNSNRILSVLLGTLIPAFFIQLHGQQPEWKKLTDFSGNNSIKSLSAGQGDTVYCVSADKNLYYSTDSGEVWQPFDNVHGFNNFNGVYASQTTNRVFFTTAINGIQITDDLGKNWQSQKIGGVSSVSGFASPVSSMGIDGNTVIATISSILGGNIVTSLFLSRDNGDNFTELGITPFFADGFAFYRDSVVFSNSPTGLFVTDEIDSNDWQMNSFSGQYVSDVETTDDRIFASVYSFSGNGEVHMSSDHGHTWNLLPGFPQGAFISDITYDSDRDLLYAVSDTGVFMYFDNTWERISDVKKAHRIISTASGNVHFGGVRVNGIMKKVPGNSEITLHSQGPALPASFSTITDDEQLYYASQHTSFLSRIDLNTLETDIYELFDHLPYTRIVSIAKDTGGNCIVGGMHYIARVADKGDSIEIIADTGNAPKAPIYDELFPDKLFTGNNGSISMVQHSTQTHVDYSPDGGKTWGVLFNDTLPGHPDLFDIKSVQVGTSHSFIMGMAFQTARDEVLMSKDGGQSWEILPEIGNSELLRQIYIDKENTLYGVSHAGVYKWNAATEEWEQLDVQIGSASNREIEVRFDPENNPLIMVRSTTTPKPEEGIYLLDENKEYKHIPFPEENGRTVRLTELTFNKDGIPIALSTTNVGTFDDENNGVYYYSDITLSSPDIPRTNDPIRVYPNPANARVSLSEPVTAKARLIGMNGKASEIKIESGKFSVVDIPGGFYILRFSQDGRIRTAKLIVSE